MRIEKICWSVSTILRFLKIMKLGKKEKICWKKMARLETKLSNVLQANKTYVFCIGQRSSGSLPDKT